MSYDPSADYDLVGHGDEDELPCRGSIYDLSLSDIERGRKALQWAPDPLTAVERVLNDARFGRAEDYIIRALAIIRASRSTP